MQRRAVIHTGAAEAAGIVVGNVVAHISHCSPAAIVAGAGRQNSPLQVGCPFVVDAAGDTSLVARKSAVGDVERLDTLDGAAEAQEGQVARKRAVGDGKRALTGYGTAEALGGRVAGKRAVGHVERALIEDSAAEAFGGRVVRKRAVGHVERALIVDAAAE